MLGSIKYSVLRYSPSTVSGEAINLGILFFEERSGYREFVHTKKYARLSKFDDTLDIDRVKALLKGIKEDVSPSLFTNNDFSLDEYIKFYINDYNFGKPKELEYSSFEETKERITKTYLRFDYPVNDRPSKVDDSKFICDLLKSKGIATTKNCYVSGRFEDKIHFDIVADDYCIKLLNYDDKDLSRSIDSAKAWAWNCKYGLENGKTPIVIYRYSEDCGSQSQFRIIKNIFDKANARFMDIDSGVELIQNIS